MFRWSLRRILDWKTEPQVPCPIYHIHGRRDFILPAKRTCPDQLIADGGHIISLTNPNEVNDFITSVLAEIAGSD